MTNKISYPNEVINHLTNTTADNLKIYRVGNPGAGGAYSKYAIKGFTDYGDTDTQLLSFQEGPIPTHGVNGYTNEILLSLVIDRLEHFQAGPFACEENRYALESARRAITYLIDRTKDRVQRQVEGKMER
jgi:hypothetical protein